MSFGGYESLGMICKAVCVWGGGGRWGVWMRHDMDACELG